MAPTSQTTDPAVLERLRALEVVVEEHDKHTQERVARLYSEVRDDLTDLKDNQAAIRGDLAALKSAYDKAQGFASIGRAVVLFAVGVGTGVAALFGFHQGHP